MISIKILKSQITLRQRRKALNLNYFQQIQVDLTSSKQSCFLFIINKKIDLNVYLILQKNESKSWNV